MLVEADELYTACLTLGDGIGLLQAQQQTIYYQLPERLLAELEHTNDAAKGGGGGGGGGGCGERGGGHVKRLSNS